jgi:hypothetical protein
MNEPVPREIIQMTVTASQQETRCYGIGICTFYAVRMDKVGQFRPVRVGFDIEQTRIVFSQKTAFHASKPTRKRPDRNTDFSLGGKGTRTVVIQKRWNPQMGYLRTEYPTHGSK